MQRGIAALTISSRDASDCEVTDQDPAAGELGSEGDEVIITVDCAQVDCENREGAQWDAFNEAYQSSFDVGCQALFDESPTGSLYGDDVQYTAVAQGLTPQSSALPESIAEGHAYRPRHDARRNARAFAARAGGQVRETCHPRNRLT